MQVVAARRGGPLEAVQRREDARPVPLLGGFGGLRPRRAGKLVALEDGRAGLHRDDGLDRGLHAFLGALLGHLVPALALRIFQQFRAAVANLVGDAEVLGVIGDGNPVQRPVLLVALAIVENDFATRRNAEQVLRGQRDAEHPGVEREAGMDMRHAPEDAGRKLLIDVGRVRGRLRLHGLWCIRRRRRVLRRGTVTEACECQHECGAGKPGCNHIRQPVLSCHGASLDRLVNPDARVAVKRSKRCTIDIRFGQRRSGHDCEG